MAKVTEMTGRERGRKTPNFSSGGEAELVNVNINEPDTDRVYKIKSI